MKTKASKASKISQAGKGVQEVMVSQLEMCRGGQNLCGSMCLRFLHLSK